MASLQRALNFDPGTAYSYSNTGFNLFPILIERVLGNGKTFEAFTGETIFTPLGMKRTRWRDDFRAIVPYRALAYAHRDGAAGWVQDTPIENLIGVGGLLTTVGDLLLWNENFTHAKVGCSELVKAQQTPATLSGGRQIPYAAGLLISTVNGLREVSHGGSTGGYRTWLGRYPDQAVSVAVLCNSAAANPAKLGRDTASLWTGAPTGKLPATSYTGEPAKMEELAGMYRKLRDNTVIRIKWHDGKLTAERGDTEFVPVAASRFLLGTTELTVVFEDGTPIRARVITPDGDIVYKRVEPAQPTPDELAVFAGEYESGETGSTLTLAPGVKPGEMTYRIGTKEPVTLRPTFRDAFETPSGSSIYFVRDASGKVIALSAGEDRVWDLRFKRVP